MLRTARASTKWLLLFGLLLTALLLARPLVFAEEGTTKPPRSILETIEKEKFENRVMEASNPALKKNLELKDRLASESGLREEKLKQITRSWEQMDRRLKQAIAKEENLIGRLERRVAEAKARGKDTTAAEAKLAEAKAKLVKIKADLATLEAKASGLMSSTNPKALIPGLLGDIQALKRQLIDLHKILQSMLPLIHSDDQKEGSSSARPSKPPKASSESAGI